MIILLTSSDHAAFFFQGGYIAMTTNALQSAIFTTFPPRRLRRDWELGTSAKPPLLLRALSVLLAPSPRERVLPLYMLLSFVKGMFILIACNHRLLEKTKQNV